MSTCRRDITGGNVENGITINTYSTIKTMDLFKFKAFDPFQNDKV